MTRLVRLIVVLVGVGALIALWLSRPSGQLAEPALTTVGSARYYEFVAETAGTVVRVAQGFPGVSRLAFTPDGQFLLIAQLTGAVSVLRRTETEWQLQSDPLVTVPTAVAGFPPEENGLVGIAFGADYETSGDLFLAYASVVATNRIVNRIARATIRTTNAGPVLELTAASEPVDVFEANVPTSSAHQIQDLVAVMIEDVPHILFSIGEGFVPERANDLAFEAGKLMLIDRAGHDPRGARPFPDFPKIQATGLRNAPALALNPFDPVGRGAIVDTGDAHFDRFLYAQLVGATDKEPITGLAFGWDGTDASLAADRPDPNVPGKPNAVLYRWDPTHTATNIVFHPGGAGGIPLSTADRSSVLVSLFGPTLQTGPDQPGRAIWLGALTHADQPAVSWTPYIRRTAPGLAEPGHPLGLVRDPVSNNLWFADIVTGEIFEARLNPTSE